MGEKINKLIKELEETNNDKDEVTGKIDKIRKDLSRQQVLERELQVGW